MSAPAASGGAARAGGPAGGAAAGQGGNGGWQGIVNQGLKSMAMFLALQMGAFFSTASVSYAESSHEVRNAICELLYPMPESRVVEKERS